MCPRQSSTHDREVFVSGTPGPNACAWTICHMVKQCRIRTYYDLEANWNRTLANLPFPSRFQRTPGPPRRNKQEKRRSADRTVDAACRNLLGQLCRINQACTAHHRSSPLPAAIRFSQLHFQNEQLTPSWPVFNTQWKDFSCPSYQRRFRNI